MILIEAMGIIEGCSKICEESIIKCNFKKSLYNEL